MKKIIITSILVIIILLGVYSFIPKNNFVMHQAEDIKDSLFGIIDIDNYINQIDNEEIIYSNNWNVESKILGNIVNTYMVENDIDKINTRVNITKNSFELIIFDEKVNNQKFYFTEEGKLVAFISTSNENKGKAIHYFIDDEQVRVEIEYENAEEYYVEDSKEIMQRAKYIYNEYINKKDCSIELNSFEQEIRNKQDNIIGQIYNEYPVLCNNDENNSINEINRKIKQEAIERYNSNGNELRAITNNIVIEEGALAECNYYIKETYIQKYLDYKTLSYIIQIEKCLGEQIETTRIVKNYDLMTGEELVLEDICQKDIKEFNNRLINKFQYEYDRQIYNNSSLEKNIEKVKFYLTNDYVVFYFDKGIVSKNIIETEVRYKDLK